LVPQQQYGGTFFHHEEAHLGRRDQMKKQQIGYNNPQKTLYSSGIMKSKTTSNCSSRLVLRRRNPSKKIEKRRRISKDAN
jgi:hypothetical protein